MFLVTSSGHHGHDHGHGRRRRRCGPPRSLLPLALLATVMVVTMMPVPSILASSATTTSDVVAAAATSDAKVEVAANLAGAAAPKPAIGGTEPETTKTETEATEEYLYEGDPAATPHVVEYHHPKIHNNLTATNAVADTKDDAAADAPVVESKGNVTADANATAAVKEEQDDESHLDLQLPADTVVIVVFYAHWCPHCRLYKKEYIKLARETKEHSYGDVPVQFMAVECTVNGDVCNHYDVEGYPTVMGFPLPPDDEPDDGDGEAAAGGVGRKRRRPTHGEPILLNENPLTPEFVGYNLGFGVARVPKDKLDKYSDSTDQKEYESTFEELATAREVFLRGKLEFPGRTIREVYHDAEASLRFALRHQIFRGPKGPLSVERASALSAWIDLLHWSLPSEFGGLGIIHDVREEFHSVVRGKENLLEVLDRHKNDASGYVAADLLPPTSSPKLPSSPDKWTESCSHGQSGMGYTCGLWELFHLITVGVSQRYITGFTDGEDVSTLNAADTLRNYISNFFACDVCRNNFLGYYDACGGDVCTRLSREFPSEEGVRELPMWLWEMHNAVNVRLAGENARLLEWRNVTEGEKVVARFPTQDMCPKCWRTDNDGSWDADVVFDYLTATYWPGGEDPVEYSSPARRRKLSMMERIDDNSSTRSAKWAFILPFGLLVGITARGALFRRRLARSGRHKKFEEDCPRYASAREWSNVGV